MTPTVSSIVALLVAVTLAACGSSKNASFYTLGQDPALSRDGDATSVYIVVGPVTVPDLVDRPQIVTRRAGNEVELHEFVRWAQPLKMDIARAIASDLSQLLGSEQVTVFDASSDASRAWRVRVDVMSFDTTIGDSVTVDALWAVRPPGKQPVLTGRSLAHEPVRGAGYDALISAHDRALASVSRDIASAIRTTLAK
jgi:uncharacterized protein